MKLLWRNKRPQASFCPKTIFTIQKQIHQTFLIDLLLLIKPFIPALISSSVYKYVCHCTSSGDDLFFPCIHILVHDHQRPKQKPARATFSLGCLKLKQLWTFLSIQITLFVRIVSTICTDHPGENSNVVFLCPHRHLSFSQQNQWVFHCKPKEYTTWKDGKIWGKAEIQCHYTGARAISVHMKTWKLH